MSLDQEPSLVSSKTRYNYH